MSSSSNDWIVKAEADFNSAEWEMKAAPATINFDAVVFHAQQCIEKLLKAALVARNISFQRTHDLNVLANMMKQAEPTWIYDVVDLATVQPGAVLTRYPGYAAGQQEAEDALLAGSRLRNGLLPFL